MKATITYNLGNIQIKVKVEGVDAEQITAYIREVIQGLKKQ